MLQHSNNIFSRIVVIRKSAKVIASYYEYDKTCQS